MPKKKEQIEEKEEIKKENNKKAEEKIEKKEKVKSKSKKESSENETKSATNKSKEDKNTEKKTEKNKEENKKELVVKDKELDKVKLDKIEEEIKKQTTIPDEKKKKINKRLFRNIMIAIGIVVYFIFINLGFYNLEALKFLKDLQVFSIVTIGITIIIFEIAYKKDSGELAIYGIESLILSICTLLTIFILINYKNKFTYIINVVSMLFGIYYIGKCIIIYVKMRKMLQLGS